MRLKILSRILGISVLALSVLACQVPSSLRPDTMQLAPTTGGFTARIPVRLTTALRLQGVDPPATTLGKPATNNTAATIERVLFKLERVPSTFDAGNFTDTGEDPVTVATRDVVGAIRIESLLGSDEGVVFNSLLAHSHYRLTAQAKNADNVVVSTTPDAQVDIYVYDPTYGDLIELSSGALNIRLKDVALDGSTQSTGIAPVPELAGVFKSALNGIVLNMVGGGDTVLGPENVGPVSSPREVALGNPTGMAVAPADAPNAGEIFFLDREKGAVYRYNPTTQEVAWVVGGSAGNPPPPQNGQDRSSAIISNPTAIAFHDNGDFFVSSDSACRIYRVNWASDQADPDAGENYVETVAGLYVEEEQRVLNGSRSEATFLHPTGLVCEPGPQGRLVVCDDYTLRLVDLTKAPTDSAFVTTIAGDPTEHPGSGDEPQAEGPNDANTARFNCVRGITREAGGAGLLFCDSLNNRIRLLHQVSGAWKISNWLSDGLDHPTAIATIPYGTGAQYAWIYSAIAGDGVDYRIQRYDTGDDLTPAELLTVAETNTSINDGLPTDGLAQDHPLSSVPNFAVNTLVGIVAVGPAAYFSDPMGLGDGYDCPGLIRKLY